MGLLDDLSLESKVAPCKVRTLAESMEEADRTTFIEAVMDPRWPAKRLEAELRKRGVKISDTPISAHRAKACSCWKI